MIHRKEDSSEKIDETEDTSKEIDDRWSDIGTALEDLQDNAKTLCNLPIDTDERELLNRMINAVIEFKEKALELGRRLE